MPERVPWSSLAFLTVAALALIGIGAALGVFYCEYRRVTEVQQLSQITQQVSRIGEACVESLTEVTRAAVIFARTQPRPVALLPAVRDSLRAARWTTP